MAGAGREVEVIGMNSLPYLAEEDRELVRGKKWKYTAVPGPLDPANRGKNFLCRLSRRMANELAAKTGIQTTAQLGGWKRDLLRVALERKVDLTIAHSASTLWVARELMSRGQKVAVDFEDWFSREHFQVPWYPHRVVARLEREVLAGASHATCTSEAMAEEIGQAYGRKPEVIYNSFPLAEAPQPAGDPGPEGPAVLWISQVVGPGRGLELLAGALNRCKPRFQVTLVGDAQEGYKQKLKSLLSEEWRGRLHFRPQVKSSEVLELVGKFHIGLALERQEPESRNLTVTNKILQYLLCGLAVVATRTRGQGEVADIAERAVELVKQNEENELAFCLMQWSKKGGKLHQARKAARRAAEKSFFWEKEASRLLKLIETVP